MRKPIIAVLILTISGAVAFGQARDGIIAKAQSAVTKKLKDPGSAQFTTVKRAMRKNVRGEAVDSVCGMVNAKNSYGGYTGARPFVYLVKNDSAFLVDGDDSTSLIASMAYKNICIDGAR